MKKLLIILAFSLTLTACTTNLETTGSVTSGTTTFYIVKIGDCEYVEYVLVGGGVIFTHKGDCSNPIHYQCNCK